MINKLFSIQNRFENNRFDAIQALRGLAVIFVFFEHIRFLSRGAFGVDIFFCISGFMIMLSTEKTTKHFFLKRLIRIVPLYYLMTFVTWLGMLIAPSLFQSTQPQFDYLLKSLLFIPFEINGAIRPIMGIGWSINSEMFFYFLFFIAFHINHKYRGLICSIFLMGLVLAEMISGTFGFDSVLLEFYGNSQMLDFAIGILCFHCARWVYYHSAEKIKKQIPFCSLIIVSIIIVVLFLMPSFNQNGLNRTLIWGIPSSLLLMLFFAAGLYYRFPTWLVHLGNISFSVYLMHYYIVVILDRLIFDFGEINAGSLIGVIVAFALTLCVAEVTNRMIEHKFSRYLQAKMMK